MGLADLKLLTEAEYLTLERESSVRHELVGGTVYAMAGATEQHNTIAGNLFAKLHAARGQGPCRPFMGDMKLRVDSGTTYYYPDVMLVCDPLDDDPIIKTLPCLIAEVTSASTEATDRREKWAAYLRMATLREYLILSQDRPLLDLYQRKRTSDPWKHQSLGRDEAFSLVCVPIELTVNELFEHVRFVRA